jgi:two-component system OmpR family sensor kinase
VKLLDRGAGAPLFLRIFMMMLACVAVVQIANVALLLSVDPPPTKVYTVGQIVDTLHRGGDSSGELRVKRVAKVEREAWNPRGERVKLGLAVALDVPPQRIEVAFRAPFLQRRPVYTREGVPAATAPRRRETARDFIVVGEFTASILQPDGGWISVESASSGFEPWRQSAIFWLLLAVAAVAPFAWALSHRLAKPILAFAQAAERLGRDPRAPPLTLGGPAEISDAAAAFNQMQARLNRYVDDRSTLIAAIAHDLRTPLMRLELRLEGAPDKVRRACQRDIGDMEAMIAATLAFVRDSTEPAGRRPLDLRSLAETVTDDMADCGDPVTLESGEDAIVLEGNSAALKAMLSNLVGNAVKYAGSAEVALHSDGAQAVIEVRDNGPGIAAEDLDRVFEPFFRGERSRNRDTGGIGLGLASVRAVARAHGGDVEVENRPEGGLMARVVLPV